MPEPWQADQKSTDRANDRLAVTAVKELSECANSAPVFLCGRAYLSNNGGRSEPNMFHQMSVVVAITLASATAAISQGGLPNPALENRIPAPLPPPPPPPIINGPLSQSPPPTMYQPPRLRTHSDRTLGCVQQGAGAGLRGGDLDAYTRDCVNQ
jgi:hypothetical protein